MKSDKIKRKGYIQLGCTLMCSFYLLGVFNGLVLEMLHEISHIVAPRTHSHTFVFGHEIVDYSSLEGMAGHSHEALKELKELLEANNPKEDDSKNTLLEKLDKHMSDKVALIASIGISVESRPSWHYQENYHFRYPKQEFPPPRYI